MRGSVLLSALLIAACSKTAPQAEPETVKIEAAPAAQAVAPEPQRTFTANRSSLAGNVSDLRVRITETTTIVDLPSDVLFAFGSAELGADAQAQLMKVVPLIRQGKPGPVEVIGHTDAVGDDASNLRLSEQRAQAVVAWLNEGPVDGRAYRATGRGEGQPIASNAGADGGDDPVGRARNRRVEIVVPR